MEQSSARGMTAQLPNRKHKRSRRKDYIRDAERKHFSFGNRSKDALLARLAPVIKNNAKQGIRKPKDVSALLNNLGLQTACGGRWTPRLAHLLLAMMFERGGPEHDIWGRRPPQREPRSGAKARSTAPSNVDRLSSLPNPLSGHMPTRVRIRRPSTRVIQSSRLKPPKREDLRKILHRLPSMSLDKMIALWRNAVRQRCSGMPGWENVSQRVIDAINEEWRRRGLQISPDQYFRWPSTEAFDGDGSLTTSEWPDQGLLKFMGYSVGRTEGLSRPDREAMLSEIFVSYLPPVCSPHYISQWGKPRTAARLQKMAETIAALTRNAKRQRGARMDDAIRDWETDLRYLYEEYYVRHFRFNWPSTVV